MSDSNTLARPITVDMLRNALNLVTYHNGPVLEDPEPPCEWSQLCDIAFCRFPRYQRAGGPVGLVAHTLLEVGLPSQLLRELDTEYEMGEVLHPGVKIGRSRNPVLRRFDYRGMALLTYVQEHQKVGWNWQHITLQAFRSSWMTGYLDKRRRPWLY